MSTPLKMMADRIKELRLVLEIEIEEMAKICSVSVEQYMEVEKGNEDVSFNFLYKCATRFGIDISELVTGDMPKLSSYTLCRNGDGMMVKRRKGFDYLHIAPLFKNRFSEPFIVTAKYEETSQSTPLKLSTHKGQELNYVLKGSLKVQVDDHVEILNEGDSIYYDSMHPHGMVAINGEDCQFLALVLKGESKDAVYEQYNAHVNDIVKLNTNEALIYKDYINETNDETGKLIDVSFLVPKNFNFAHDVVDRIAEKNPKKLAMVWVSNDKKRKDFTFEDISRESSKAANYLTSLGIKRGDNVMIILKRHYQFWSIINALHKIGAVVIPATNLLTVKDISYRINAANVKCVFASVDGSITKNIDLAQQELGVDLVKLSVNGQYEGWNDFDKNVELYSDKFNRNPLISSDDTMIMYFTSGTTGYPKIVTHKYSYPIGHIVTARYWHNVDPNGLHFTISDTGWAKSVWGKLYGQWLCEAAIFTYDFDRFDACDILPMFKEYNITTFCAPPTMYRFFIKENLNQFDLSSLKHASIAGEALNPEVYEQFLNATGLKLMEGFGQTETTLTVFNIAGTTPKPGSMGKPSPAYNIALIDSQGNEVKEGEVGEIVLKTEKGTPIGMFSGYYNDIEKTKEVWYDDVYHTGDMAWIDEDGYLWYVGRTDDLIKSSGYRIGPFEIESVLMELPYILECAITGVPDPTRGQVVKATIVLIKDKEKSEQLKKEIQDYVKKHTAPYKYPRIIEFVDALPKTISGKIRRVEIRDN